MSSTPRATIERLFELVDGHRWNEYADVMTDDVVMTSPFGVLHGPTEWAEFSKGFAVAVPDGAHAIDRCVESGSTIAIEGTWRGTNTGPITTPQGETPPSGASVVLPFAALGEVRDGKVARVNVYLDQMAFLVQVGLVPAPIG